jgi:hypothetical protein
MTVVIGTVRRFRHQVPFSSPVVPPQPPSQPRSSRSCRPGRADRPGLLQQQVPPHRYDRVARHTFSRMRGRRRLRRPLPVLGAVADGQLAPIGKRAPDLSRCHLVRLQGPGGHFCAFHGCWRDVRKDGRHLGQGGVSVRLLLQTTLLLNGRIRAYPHAALFAACDPEKPCITPGTYAFLGAAAALA